MSASFPIRASKSDDLFIRSIVIASDWMVRNNPKHGDVIASDRRKRGNLNLLF
jgi:hypothetical protein